MTSEWLHDVFGPDGVRVTLCVEPAVQRLIRERDAWFSPRPTIFPSPVRTAARRLIPEVIQSRLLKGRWAVVIEADSGERLRLMRDTHGEAQTMARTIWQQVHEEGVSALKALK
ncbi:MAG: hypothetical protein JWM40_1612 [Frankiales bacterium]|nr:hypothetical protein [Frankiales bacterium]